MDSLDANWLSVELDTVDREVEGWSDGLKESFDSLFTSVLAAAAEDTKAVQSAD